jgi:hypothetical protein
VISLPASTSPAEARSTEAGQTETGRAAGGPVEIAMRIGGTVIGVGLAIATAVWEAVLTTWYVIIGGHVIRLPVAPLLAIVANIALFWFVRKVTGKLSLAIFPALAWLAVMVVAGNVTSDGDLIVSGTWIGVTTLLLGTAGWAIPGYRALLKRPSPQPAPPAVSTTRKTVSPSSTAASPGPKSQGAKGPGPKAQGAKGQSPKGQSPKAQKPAGAGAAGPKNKRR